MLTAVMLAGISFIEEIKKLESFGDSLAVHYCVQPAFMSCMYVTTDYTDRPTTEAPVLQAQCDLSNDKKVAAKRVSELSSELFFAIFVRVTCPSVLVLSNSE